jgi:hypothetical protein
MKTYYHTIQLIGTIRNQNPFRMNNFFPLKSFRKLYVPAETKTLCKLIENQVANMKLEIPTKLYQRKMRRPLIISFSQRNHIIEARVKISKLSFGGLKMS